MCAQYFRPSGDVTYEPHTHSEYTLVVCLAGAVSKTQFGRNCVVGRGGAVMGNFGVEHASAYVRDGEPCEAVSLTVNRKALDQLLAEFQLPLPHENACPVFLGSLENSILSRSARELARELQAREHGHKIVIQGLGMRMLVEALRAWPRSQVDRCEVDSRPRLPRRDFVRAYEFMRWCRKDAFRLKHLCGLLGSSEERFARLFRAATDCSPATFYNRLLLERARDILRDPSLSIKEVGFEVGFRTTSHFIAAFRQRFGASPNEYRHRLLDSPATAGVAEICRPSGMR
jgi:AraC-like DNA-binding protein